MSARTKERRIAGFYTTSPEILDAYRKAARKHGTLRRFTTADSWPIASPSDELKARQVQGYLLSHVNDEIVLPGPEIKSRLSGMPRLLLTEPSTPPDRLGRWVQELGMTTKTRYYIREVNDLKSPQLIELLERIGLAESRGVIVDAYLDGRTLVVVGPRLRKLEVPISSVSALRDQAFETLRNFEVDPDGSFLYWPDLDVHLGWDQFLQVVDTAELHKAQRRNADFNKRYGAAIRRVREAASLAQSDIDGLTARHLRRIETGAAPATAKALAALAKAHGFDPNAYMETLAREMPQQTG
ncbi:DUF2442 domain-containing protein [Paludisphaera rhizosphaerae]|uniref:DUF2442 domain-containing protein n=1 Tax=Paludisphaera rhizosphaerae TaxID=2711216 RepID=UPI0013EA3F64|nr:DUF2442 domain-containing protein [Paludisphaera rhizosphaerae]